MSASNPEMEVEIKLRLPDKQAHDRVTELLRSGMKNVYRQENFFFDGSQQELGQRFHVLRARFYNETEKCILTLKGKAIIENGIGRATELEHAIDPALGRKIVDNPNAMLRLEGRVVQAVRDKFAPEGLVCLGGFRNVRQEFAWEGQTIELDETQYDWGTLYELECETYQPEEVKEKLEDLLRSNGISYEYSSVSKFANFVNKSLE